MPGSVLHRERDFLIASLALCGLSFAFVWYQAFGLNQAIQLVYVAHWQDPSLYRRDPFLRTAAYYTTLFWPIVAHLTAVISLKTLLLVGTVVERLVAVYAAGRVAGAMAGGSSLARLAGMIVMATGPTVLLGAGTTLPDYFEQSGAAMALLLLAFACFLERRYWAWGLLVGAAANLNVLYAGYAMVYAGAVFLLLGRGKADRRGMLLGLWVMLACVIPLLVFLGRLPPRHSFDHAVWWRAMMFRSSHHLLPGSWSPIRFAEFGVLILLLTTVGFWSGPPRRDGPWFVLRCVAISVAATGVASLGAAFAVAYAVKIPVLLQIQPIRATDFGYCLSDILLAAGAAMLFESNWAAERRRPMVFTLLLLACLWPVLPVAAPAVAIGVGTGAFLLLPRGGAHAVRRAMVACGIAVVVAAIARPAFTAKYVKFNTGDRWPVSGAAAWVRTHTSRDALFLVDADDGRTEPFRALATRSVFVHVKDGTALFYDPEYLTVWRSRMNLAGYPLPDQHQPTKPYLRWSDADALKLARSARLDYWLLPRERLTALDVIFADASFKVVRFPADVGEVSPHAQTDRPQLSSMARLADLGYRTPGSSADRGAPGVTAPHADELDPKGSISCAY